MVGAYAATLTSCNAGKRMTSGTLMTGAPNFPVQNFLVGLGRGVSRCEGCLGSKPDLGVLR